MRDSLKTFEPIDLTIAMAGLMPMPEAMAVTTINPKKASQRPPPRKNQPPTTQRRGTRPRRHPRTDAPSQKIVARSAAEADDTTDTDLSAPEEAMAVDTDLVGLAAFATAVRVVKTWAAAAVWAEGVKEDAGGATTDEVLMEYTQCSRPHLADPEDLMHVDLLTTVAVVVHLDRPLVPLISGK